MNFNEFNFHPDLQEGLEAMRFEKATPIQDQAIPIALAGNDILACAQTGTGKTAAFLLPIMHHILINDERDFVNTIIIAPTRELAQQISQQIDGLAYFTGIGSIVVIGGGDGSLWEQQKQAILKGAEIVVATPGRLIALLNDEKVKLDKVKHLILDEADKMLDMGFAEDLQRIIANLPKDRQTLMFSATMPPKIRQLAKNILKEPSEINLNVTKPAEGVSQKAFLAHDDQKIPLLNFLLKSGRYKSIIVFCGTIDKVKKVNKAVAADVANLTSSDFHSGLEQPERERIMREFKAGKVNVLIGTDILSRGIDVDGIDLVVNYDVPGDPEDYVHRVGRTARAQNVGEAITFINTQDMGKFARIEEAIEKEVMKTSSLPSNIGEGPAYQKKGGGGRNSSQKNYKKRNFNKGKGFRRKGKDN